MSNMPRILPLIGVAVGGVLALNAISGARALPDLLSGASAFAEEAKARPGEKAATGEAAATAAKAALPPGAGAGPAKPPAPVCAPTAAELARQAGLSPAELQVLQSLGARRGQLEQREQDLNVQLALLAAAEAKVDAKLKSMNALKAEVQGLMAQADQKEEAETTRLVKVFESMKAKDAAPRMELLDDSVRLPIAAKMKERVLSAILAEMKPAEAKRLTEALARRHSAAKAAAAAAAAQAQAVQTAAAEPAKVAAAPAAKPAPRKPAPKPAAPKPAPEKTAEAPAAPAEKGGPAKPAEPASKPS
ncbi:MotE family protein [Phenylobacterium sp.]|jgi:flagellar motility protein MotE (MotC chaperone)|uniref:MotE family protein n=1 Tax=Phenylobacterium sp. TaxID=1871053 RepID=UPI002E2FA7AF|nr:MotE family protein [Phenylobacterium sp.]HEX2559271.1 MotE family protein [Phenylobacterium sp.]